MDEKKVASLDAQILEPLVDLFFVNYGGSFHPPSAESKWHDFHTRSRAVMKAGGDATPSFGHHECRFLGKRVPVHQIGNFNL